MLLPTTYASRWPARLGLLAMLGLLGLSWHFYLERVAYSDLAYHVFVNIQTKATFIQHRRVAQIPAQLLPVAGIRLGWPLDILLRIFSISFILYYLLVYVLSAYGLRNVQAALLVPLSMLLLAARTFYWPQDELAQSMAALLLAHALLSREAPLRASWRWLASVVLIGLSIFGHPLVIIAFLFLWAYDWLLRMRWRDWGFYAVLAAGLLAYYLRLILIPAGTYEDVSGALQTNFIAYYPHYLGLASFQAFWVLCRGNFLALPVVLLLCTGYYLWQRSWLATLRLALVWSAVALYTLIVNVWEPNYCDPTYLENLYLPLGIFIAAPLVFELLPALERSLGRRGPAVAAAVVGLLFAGRLLTVYGLHDSYTAYQQWLNRSLAYTAQFPERRFLVDDVNIDTPHLRAGWPWWSTGYETLLLSSRPSPDSAQVFFVTNNIPGFLEHSKVPNTFMALFDFYSASELDSRYFRLRNEAASYRLINTLPPTDTSALRRYIAVHQRTSLTFVELPYTLKATHQQVVRVQVAPPPEARPLHSGMRTAHPTMLRSRFLDPSYWPVQTPPQDTPLDMDVWQPWQQDVVLNCPSKPGKYILEVMLVSKDYRDWPVTMHKLVEVE